MAKKKFNTAKLGLFVTIGLALFIGAVYLIGSNENMFQPSLRIGSVFNNVNGLQPGNNVRYSGINVGTVESITLLSDTLVQVNMKIERDVQEFIQKNSIASIGSDGLVGSMLVNISPGEGPAPTVEEGDLLPSYSRVKTEDLLNTLGKTNENIALISNDLLRITSQLTKGKGTMGMLLRDTILAASMRQSAYNLERVSGQLLASGAQLRKLIGDIEEGDGFLSQLLYDTTLFASLDTSISQVDTLIARQVQPLFEELQYSATEIRAASTTLHSVVEQLDEGEGLAPTLLRDTAMVGKLQQTLDNVEEGTARFNENMEAMRHHFLFRGYFKKLEKEEQKRKKD